MEKEELELALKLIELSKRDKSMVEKTSDLVVGVVEAPFKIAGQLLDDLFGF